MTEPLHPQKALGHIAFLATKESYPDEPITPDDFYDDARRGLAFFEQRPIPWDAIEWSIRAMSERGDLQHQVDLLEQFVEAWRPW